MTGADGAGLQPFVSRLASAWLDEHPEQRHRRLDGTLVSADLSGFTALSERLADRGKRGAEDLTAMVNSCFTALIRAAGASGGDVVKFGGDALLVWFDGAGHEVRAVLAAARMQRAIGAARFRRAGLSMSVGAHVGAFDLFLVGREDWRELVLVGEPVTTTVGLEAAASAGEVLLSRELAAAVPGAWLGERVDHGVLVAVDDVDGVGARLRASVPGTATVEAAAALVAPSLIADLGALAGTSGEHRLVTVVFAELDSTDLAVALDRPRFEASIDDLVLAVQALSERYGLLFLYTDVIADGVKLIAVAGAPRSTGEDEEASLRFATDLVAGDPQQKLRAGVNRGRVFAGFLGSDERRAYTVMGDPVNLAARLMARAEPGQVVGSDEVVRASRADFDCTPIAPFLVKGKAKPVTAHVVGAATGAHRTRDAGALPLVGREAEVEQLRAAISAATLGRGHVVEIVGDAGIGKTRLIQAVADDPRVLVRVATECQPYDALSPFAAVRPLLRRALGIVDTTLPTEVGAQLAAVVSRVAPALAPLLPLIAVPVGCDVPSTPEADAIAEEFRQARMHDAVLALLSAALPSTTLVVVEDIYYVDDASLQLLRALAAIVPERPWALFITRRPEGAALVVDDAGGTRLKLPPLDDDVVGRLAELAVGDRAVGSAELRALTERSGGNPLFVLELVDAAGAGVAAEDLPESIERLVATRVDRLHPGDRALLRQAAVVGRVFHTGLVNTLFATEGQSVVHPEQWARLGEFVEREGDRRWRFRHALFRDVAYEGLPFARRKRMHKAVGELLEAGVAGEPDVALLSLHFWLADDAKRTWRYSVAAGDVAWTSFAVGEAVAVYRRALEARRRVEGVSADDRAGVQERLGDALERLGRYDEADAAYEAARRVAVAEHRHVREARLLRKLGVLCERTGRYPLAKRRYGAGLRAVDGQDGEDAVAERAELELARGGVEHRQGHHVESRRWAERAQETAASVDSTRLVADALNLQLVAATYLDIEQVSALGERALGLYRSIGDILREGSALNNLGVAQYFLGQWADASHTYAAAATTLERAGNVIDAATARNNLAEIWSDQGRVAEAVPEFEYALRSWRVSNYAVGVAVAEGNLGRAMARLGRFDDAAQLLGSSLDRLLALGAAGLAWEGRARVAELNLLAGATTAALEVLESRKGLDTEAYPATRSAWSRMLGWAHVQLGQDELAMADFRSALALAEAARADFETALALHALAELSATTGAPHQAAYQSEADRMLERLAIVVLAEIPRPT